MKDIDRQLINLARLHLVDQREAVRLAKYINALAVRGFMELRRAHVEIPAELVAHEQFLKDMISATAVYLAQTKNWYGNFTKEEAAELSNENEPNQDGHENNYSKSAATGSMQSGETNTDN